MTLYKLDTFDLEVGMTVYGENGEVIGSVTEVSGFGSTHIDDASDANAAQVTQAQTGTGFFKVRRAGKEDLCVPFHSIKEVVPGHGVTLTAAGIAQMQRTGETPTPPASGTAQPQRPKSRRWAFWRS
jgi:hypothetical protein